MASFADFYDVMSGLITFFTLLALALPFRAGAAVPCACGPIQSNSGVKHLAAFGSDLKDFKAATDRSKIIKASDGQELSEFRARYGELGMVISHSQIRFMKDDPGVISELLKDAIRASGGGEIPIILSGGLYREFEANLIKVNEVLGGKRADKKIRNGRQTIRKINEDEEQFEKSLELAKKSLPPEHRSRIKTVRWEDLKNDPEFTKINETYAKIHQTDPAFRAEIEILAKEFYKYRRGITELPADWSQKKGPWEKFIVSEAGLLTYGLNFNGRPVRHLFHPVFGENNQPKIFKVLHEYAASDAEGARTLKGVSSASTRAEVYDVVRPRPLRETLSVDNGRGIVATP